MPREFGLGEELVFEDTNGMPIGSMRINTSETAEARNDDPDAHIGRGNLTRRYLETALGLDISKR